MEILSIFTSTFLRRLCKIKCYYRKRKEKKRKGMESSGPGDARKKSGKANQDFCLQDGGQGTTCSSAQEEGEGGRGKAGNWEDRSGAGN
jgi:hypothetical protein